jgi:hypothetical protein
MKFNIKALLIVGMAALTFSACDEWGEYQPETIPGHELAGEWYVRYTVGGVDVYSLGYNTFLTSTTAAADGKELLLDDQHNFWDFVVKTPMDVASKTFSAPDSLTNLVEGYDIKILVKNGKVIPNGGKSKTGVEVDSIYFEVEFADDPGTIYEISGHERTGFGDDDY